MDGCSSFHGGFLSAWRSQLGRPDYSCSWRRGEETTAYQTHIKGKEQMSRMSEFEVSACKIKKRARAEF